MRCKGGLTMEEARKMETSEGRRGISKGTGSFGLHGLQK